jgi:small subunit ribosomal protein S9
MAKEIKKGTAYFEAVGRRKTAVARVRLMPGESGFTVNDLDYKKYFKTDRDRSTAYAPLKLIAVEKIGVSVKTSGSGLPSQAGAVSLGIARAFLKMDAGYRPTLKAAGLLTRDPRMVERKKYGLKKARRAPQWAKR